MQEINHPTTTEAAREMTNRMIEIEVEYQQQDKVLTLTETTQILIILLIKMIIANLFSNNNKFNK